MSQPHRLTDDQLTVLQEQVTLITRTLPWTPTNDRESPDHPWVDVWGGDGDLLLEVGRAPRRPSTSPHGCHGGIPGSARETK